MEIEDGTKVEPRRGRSGLVPVGVTGTAVALFAVAIFFGARHAGDQGPTNAAAPPPTAGEAAGAEVAVAPPSPANHPPRRLEAANRKELVSTLPRGAPVDVTANEGDPEALRLAEEIRSFLLAKGYRATDVTRNASTPPAKGVGLEPLAGGKWKVIVGSAEE
jgi:hypothetical protein